MSFNTEAINGFIPSFGAKELQTTYKDKESQLQTYNEVLPNRPNILLLPGIAPLGSRSFAKQIDFFTSKANLYGLEYAQQGFDVEEVQNKITKNFFPIKDLTIVGLSFGARVITQMLCENPELAKLVKNLVLIGPFFQLDRKNGTLSLLKNVRTRIPIQSLGFFEEPLVQIARNKFNYDSGFYNSEEDKRKMIEETNLKGLGARMNYFAKHFEFDQTVITPTTLVWWEREPASQEQKEKITRIFPNNNVITIPGKHGHTYQQSNEINRVIETVIKY